jgi:predicted ATPase
MKLDSIFIENFRAIGRLSLENLPDGVVLAGPSGCGKSCVLDALRLP